MNRVRVWLVGMNRGGRSYCVLRIGIGVGVGVEGRMSDGNGAELLRFIRERVDTNISNFKRMQRRKERNRGLRWNE